MIDNRRDNLRKRNFLFVFTEKKSLKEFFSHSVSDLVIVEESKVGSFHIAKYIMNCTSWQRNII
jgi:hypothetical protein